jgi:DNA-binding beta-propeller fold protein YncE
LVVISVLALLVASPSVFGAVSEEESERRSSADVSGERRLDAGDPRLTREDARRARRDPRRAAAADPLGLRLLGNFASDSDTPGNVIHDGHDVAFDAAGNIYATDPFNNTIKVMDSVGNAIRVYPTGEPDFSTAPGEFDTPLHIAINRVSGDIYVTERFNHRVQRFDSNFNLLGMWGKDGGVNGESGSGNGEFDVPDGLAVDPITGNVYVADSKNNRVQFFTADGTYLGEIGDSPCAVSPSCGMEPRGVAVDDNGGVWVAHGGQVSLFDSTDAHDFEGYREYGESGSNWGQVRGVGVSPAGDEVWTVDTDNGRVSKHDITYNPDGSIGATGFALPPGDDGEIAFNNFDADYPRGIGVDPATGNAVIADFGLPWDAPDPLVVVNGANAFVTGIGSRVDTPGNLYHPWHVATTSVGARGAAGAAATVIYVSEPFSMRVQKFSSSGALLDVIGGHGTGNGEFQVPIGVAVDAAGNLYVSDSDLHRVQVFDSTGKFLRKWGTAGSGNGQFNQPRGIAIDASGQVFVADRANHRVQVFDTAGNYQRQFGSLGGGAGDLNRPHGVAIDSAGNVWVGDVNNGRVQKFDNAGNSLMSIGGLGAAVWVTVDASGNVIVGEFGAAGYKVFDSTGASLGTLAAAVPVGGVTVGSDGKVYLVRKSNTGLGFIYGGNAGPIAANDSYTTAFSTTLSIEAPGVLSNDTDPNGDGLTAALAIGADNGTVTLNADGSFEYIPSVGFVGTDTFTYTADDGFGRMSDETVSAPATVTITVAAAPNEPPVAANDTYSTQGQLTVNATQGVLANDTDPDGDSLSATVVSTTSNGSLVLSDSGRFTYTPDSDFGGADSFTYRVSDGSDSDTATATINVTACTFATDTTSMTFDASGGSGAVRVTTQTGCEWRARGKKAWISVSSGGTGSGRATVTINSNTGADRLGSAVVAGNTIVISQAGAACSYVVDTTSAGFGAAGGNGSFAVTTDTECTWRAVSSKVFVSLDSSVRTGSGTVAYAVAESTKKKERVGRIALKFEGKDQRVSIMQQGVGSLEPLPPEGVNLRVRRKTNMTVKWKDGSENEDGFVVTRRAQGTPTVNFTFAANVTRLKDVGLNPLTPYCYEVAAFNDEGTSPAISGCARTSAARVATNLRVANPQGDSMALEWDEEAGESQLLERRAPGREHWGHVAELGGGVATYTDASARRDTPYEYRVRTCLTAACEPASNTVRALVSTRPEDVAVDAEFMPRPHYVSERAAVIYGNNAPDLPTRGAARIYRDAESYWGDRSVEESALVEAGYVLGASLFIHPVADLQRGVPDDTAVVVLPAAGPAAVRSVDGRPVQDALSSFLDSGGVLIVDQSRAAYRLPVQLRGALVESAGAYDHIATPSGAVFVNYESPGGRDGVLSELLAALAERLAPRSRRQ